MEILQVPFTTINWSEVQETVHPGESGHATWKTIQKGNIRVRIVE